MTKSMPSCFGLFWEGERHEDCKGCSLQNSCLHSLAMEHIPRIREELGNKATLEIVSKHMRVSPASVVAAINYAKRLPSVDPTEPLRQPDEPIEESEVITSEQVAKSMEVTKAAEETGPVNPEREKETAEAMTAEDSQEVSKTMPAKKKAATKKAAKKKASAKKKVAKKKKARSVSRPPKAGSAQSASDPAVVTQRTMADVRRARALASQTRKWGDGPTRHQRERDRNLAIASLARGATLKREYKGTLYHIRVLKGRYKVLELEQEFWTLSDVVKAITGLYLRGDRKLVNWSVQRFLGPALTIALYGPKKVAPRKHPSQAESKRRLRAEKKKKAAEEKARSSKS